MRPLLSPADGQWCWHCRQISHRVDCEAQRWQQHPRLPQNNPRPLRRLHLNKQNGEISKWAQLNKLYRKRRFFTADQRSLEMRAEETRVHSVVKETQRVVDGFSQSPVSQRLSHRKDIKAFSQSWQKNTGKWVDPVVLTKGGTGSVRVPGVLFRPAPLWWIRCSELTKQLICQGWSSLLALIAKVLVTKNSNFKNVLYAWNHSASWSWRLLTLWCGTLAQRCSNNQLLPGIPMVLRDLNDFAGI